MAAAADAEEYAHWRDVLASFRSYGAWMSSEAGRRASALAQLSPAFRDWLPAGAADYKMASLTQAVANNAAFLELVAEEQEEQGFHGGPREARPPPRPLHSAHFSKVKSTLSQIVREWSAEGAAERAASHEPILAELRTWLPLTPATVNTLTVLVPGCGLGRLPWDLACAGYAAQGNEFSYFMLFASHFILNCGPDAANAMSVHPFVHNPSCHMTNKNMLRPVPFPDIPPSAIAAINPGADLSMTAGEFCEVYGTPEHAGEWDAVVTCFFLDTAPNVCEYVQVIHAALRPGGVWVNLGPLLWHWADGPEASPGAARGPDDRFGRSLELSYAEVVACVQAAGFTLRTERRAPPTTYAGDALSLMSVVYSPMLFTAVKEEARGAEGREAAPPKPA